MRQLAFLTSLTSLLFVVACASDGSSGGDREKGDGKCASDAELIEMAKADYAKHDSESETRGADFEQVIRKMGSRLIENGPGADDDTYEEYELDLNDDGLGEVLVMPGITGAQSEGAMVLYLTEGGCPTRLAGYFWADNVIVAEDGKVTNGMPDLEQVSHTAAEIYWERFKWDGEMYQSTEEYRTAPIDEG